MNRTSQRPNYGIDTRRDLTRNALYGAGGIVMGLILLALSRGGALGILIGSVSVIAGVVLLMICAVSLWGSLVGKLRLRDRVLGALPWRGDERVLDVSDDNGLMLVGAAKHLTSGKAIGVDLSFPSGSASNHQPPAMRNAVAEGVADRVELRRGDARDLPFQPDTIDIVLSSWFIHTLPEQTDRESVLREIVRVLKPGGRAVIIDIERIDEYMRYLRENGIRDVIKSKPNYLFVTPTHTLTFVKPAPNL
jgi:SAM-dependent methyltransferase